AGFHRDRASEQDGAELGGCQPLRVSRHERGQVARESPQELRIGLEKELVEVAVRASARTEDEVALQVRGRDKVAPQRLPLANHRPNLRDLAWPARPGSSRPQLCRPGRLT